MDEIYTFLVRGPSSRLPRGYVWLIPIWFAILGGIVALGIRRFGGQLPMWLAGTEIGGILLAGLVLFCVLLTVRRHAFRIGKDGIWLGVRTTRKRPKLRQVHIAWADISQLRMVSRRYGVLLEITLGPSARIVTRPSLARQALILLGVLIMPVGFGRGRPALTAARADPPRYLIKLCDVKPAELRQLLAEVKPAALPARVLTKPSAMRYATLPGRRPTPQPTSAVSPR